MIKITIIALGKLKEKYLREASAEYEKRLSRYCKLDIIELEPVRLNEKPSQSEIDLALQKESEMIIKKIPAGSQVYSLCVEGKQFSSEDFAKRNGSIFSQGGSLTFIIGSSYGLDTKVKNLSDVRLSLSEMTFPHQLFRVMLLEQIYRSFKISEGSTYHK
jgi:23S rRNA (pseudouridine1915-N3)-methyltransferase